MQMNYKDPPFYPAENKLKSELRQTKALFKCCDIVVNTLNSLMKTTAGKARIKNRRLRKHSDRKTTI